MNRAEFDKVMREQRRMVVGEIKKIVPDVNPEDLREIEQTVWLTAWERRTKYRTIARAQTWLGAVARNVTKDWVKHELAKKRDCILYEHDLPGREEDGEAVPYYDWTGAEHAPSAEDECVRNEAQVAMLTKYMMLTPLQQKAAKMRWVEGWSSKAIAAELRCTDAAVRKLLERVRRVLES